VYRIFNPCVLSGLAKDGKLTWQYTMHWCVCMCILLSCWGFQILNQHRMEYYVQVYDDHVHVVGKMGKRNVWHLF
jgi:hypothetical protein